jgi:hypothetical protein
MVWTSVHTPVVLGPVLHGTFTPRTISLIEGGCLIAGGWYIFGARYVPGVPRHLSTLGAGALGSWLYGQYTPEEIA